MAARRAAGPGRTLVLTCEHGGNRIPPEYQALFRGSGAVLRSHRGWDPGALNLAKALGRRLALPAHAVSWSRLLVESNRAPTNSRIWSPFTAALPASDKARILERYWWPHRRKVEQAVRVGLSTGMGVIHVAVHSFTPELDGEVRNADVGLLYDSARRAERAFCSAWARALREHVSGIRVRLNYPYRGAADGLPTWLRRRTRSPRYVGIELEVNQAWLAGPRRAELTNALAEFLASV